MALVISLAGPWMFSRFGIARELAQQSAVGALTGITRLSVKDGPRRSIDGRSARY